jgi:hypothetical protein
MIRKSAHENVKSLIIARSPRLDTKRKPFLERIRLAGVHCVGYDLGKGLL